MSLPSPARGKGLAVSILSLSLLTVMAGAAVAPALGVIQAYFSGTSQTVVQLIISIPALFIVITNLCFPALSRRFSTKTLVLGGLLLYTVGGCAAGLFDQIVLVLVMRALVGVGVGILMPLSTGLLTFYYPPERQAALMGYASAMNQMGGVIATLLAGLLSQLNWRASFLVYLLGLLSIVLCLGFLPSDRLDQPQHAEEASAAGSPFRTYFVYILAMFLLMSIFFVYPANFALETTAEGAVPAQSIAVIMAGADLVAFVGGVLFVHLRRAMGRRCKLLAPVLFLLGFLLQTAVHGVKKAKTEAGRPAYAMTFGMAIEAAKKGKRIARKGWNGKGQYVELAKAISYKSPTGAVVNAEHDAIGNQALAFVGTSGVQMGWLASQADMLADDWEIVEG